MAPNGAALVTRRDRAALLHGIYAIVNQGRDSSLAIAQAALRAGVRVVQYRAKHGIVPHELRAIRDLTRAANALLVLNDDWRAAMACECDGVHLGPDDAGFIDVAPVRAALGERLIGLSCGTVEEARTAENSGADYLGVGSVYATSSKADAGDPIGIDGLRRIASATRLPVAAIGGITQERIGEVARSGVAMAAVISAIADAPDPYAASLELVSRWTHARGEAAT
jgi:thiamine-phosphate pyrophosphorylase